MTPRRVLYAGAVAAAWAAGSLAWLILFLPPVWVACAYWWPYAPCWRCRGGKTNPGSSRRRFGLCKGCGGTGGRQVIGSRAVHRAVRGAVQARKDWR